MNRLNRVFCVLSLCAVLLSSLNVYSQENLLSGRCSTTYKKLKTFVCDHKDSIKIGAAIIFAIIVADLIFIHKQRILLMMTGSGVFVPSFIKSIKLFNNNKSEPVDSVVNDSVLDENQGLTENINDDFTEDNQKKESDKNVLLSSIAQESLNAALDKLELLGEMNI